MRYPTASDPEILFEDPHILVCVKPAGLPVQTKQYSVPDLESILKNHLSLQGQSSASRENGRPPYLAVIHRLDQPVRGVLVLAKTPSAARELNRQLQADGFGKLYRALVCGNPREPAATLTDYLVKDGRTNTSRVCTPDTPGAKRAQLSYRLLRSWEPGDPDSPAWRLMQGAFPAGTQEPDTMVSRHQHKSGSSTPTGTPALGSAPQTTPGLAHDCALSEVEITLKTGRHHQIRVQFAAADLPLWGDSRYNPIFSKTDAHCPIALCAHCLRLRHPSDGRLLQFETSCQWEV